MTDRHAPSQRRLIWPPSPGWFKLRLVRGGWQVPAMICHHDQIGWWAVLDGEQFAPHDDPAHAPRVSDIWTGTIIDEATYDWLLAVKAWARQHEPDHPCLSPTKPISHRRLIPHFAPQRTT